jgi:hypothetical protein
MKRGRVTRISRRSRVVIKPQEVCLGSPQTRQVECLRAKSSYQVPIVSDAPVKVVCSYFDSLIASRRNARIYLYGCGTDLC